MVSAVFHRSNVAADAREFFRLEGEHQMFRKHQARECCQNNRVFFFKIRAENTLIKYNMSRP